MKRRVTYACLVLAILVVVPSAAASLAARAESKRTNVSISTKFPAFSGAISSKSDVCLKRRSIELLRRSSNGTPKLLGRDFSDSSGRWEVPLDNVKAGAYYARTKRKVTGKGESRLVCKPGRSEVVVID